MLAAAALLLAPLAHQAAPPADDPRLAPLVAELALEREELRVPGFAVAVVADGGLVLARGFGLADVAEERAVTPETIFAIGSTTKAFTTTLLAMLAEDGKLGWDDPVTRHLPWLELAADGKGPVTLRDLVAHRTGFGRMDVLWYGGGASAEEVLRTAIRAEPMRPFRSAFLYNNVMYLAAGEVAAGVAHAPWEELVRARLLEPLGMGSTTTSVADAQRDPRLALGYDWDEAAGRFEHVPMRALGSIAPAGALNSNVLDMSRWIRFLLARGELDGKRLLRAESLDETWKPAIRVAPELEYGLGWMLGDWSGERTVFHDGSIDGFSASVWLLPSRGTGVVLLANVRRTPLQGTIGPRVFAALHAPTPEAAASEPQTTESASGDLARYTGVYRATYFQFRDTPFTVTARDGKLAIDVPGQTVFDLAPPDADGKRAFVLVPDQIQATFTEADGKVVALVLHQGGMSFECLREGYEPPPELEPADYEPYLGTYTDPLTRKTFAVVVSHGRLAVDYPDQMVYELHVPAGDERWVFRATPQMAVEFHLDADGRAEALTFHERGTTRECERVQDELPELDALLALRGGAAFEARLAELGTCRLASTLRFVHCGIEGAARTTFDAAGRIHDVTDIRPFALTETRVDGTRAVASSSLEGEIDLDDPGRDQALAGSPAFLFGDWRRRFDTVRLVRVDEIGGRTLARIALVKGEAPELEVLVDPASGELVRAEVHELVDGAGTLAKTVTFSDWRDLEGLRLPGRITIEDDASGRVELTVVGLETGLDPALLDAR